MGAERHLSRRRLLQRGGGGLAVAAAGVRPVAAQPATPPPAVATPMGTGTGLADAALPQFEADVAAALSAFRIVGAAVALVDRRGIRFQRGFGVRDVAGGGPVTPETHFFVASTTKSMSATLVASFVDDGAFAWDQPVREVWPDFRAPTPELTESLRVRDLLGMATGIGEPPAVSSFHEGDPTAGDLLRSLATLPVIAPPQTEYFYNNTVYAAGGYLPALVQGTPENALETAYVRLLTERVYRPAGMATARITDDPRPYVTDYATGHAFEFQHGTTAVPFAPVGSYAPVGGTLASLADMSAYVATQLNAGVSPLGRRVVSAANLAECWKPHIALPRAGSLDPDREQAGYGMGWISQTYRGGRRLVWHNGGIDGYTSFIGFFPEDDLGLVVLTKMGPLPRGLYFTSHVLNLVLAAGFGLNAGANAAVDAAYEAAEQQLRDLAGKAAPVAADVVAPYLGFYAKGWRLEFDAEGTLRLHQSSRAIPLLAMPDGSYVMASGEMPGTPVRLTTDAEGLRWLEIEAFETVRWSNGLD